MTAVGVASAAVPGADNVIHTCYLKGTNVGIMRVIDTTAHGKCSRFETALNFNQQGVKGDQGIQGAQGIPGIQGVPGQTGAQGAPGTGRPGRPRGARRPCRRRATHDLRVR